MNQAPLYWTKARNIVVIFIQLIRLSLHQSITFNDQIDTEIIPRLVISQALIYFNSEAKYFC